MKSSLSVYTHCKPNSKWKGQCLGWDLRHLCGVKGAAGHTCLDSQRPPSYEDALEGLFLLANSRFIFPSLTLQNLSNNQTATARCCVTCCLAFNSTPTASDCVRGYLGQQVQLTYTNDKVVSSMTQMRDNVTNANLLAPPSPHMCLLIDWASSSLETISHHSGPQDWGEYVHLYYANRCQCLPVLLPIYFIFEVA